MHLSKLGSEIPVNTVTAGGQTLQQITSLAGGGFVVTWADNSQGGTVIPNTDSPYRSAVKAQVFDADGQPVGGEILVNTTNAYDQSHPQITALPGGGFVVTWDDEAGVDSEQAALPVDPEGYAIRAQVFAADGSKLGSEILVNTATDGDQTAPQVTTLSNGGFVITWQDNPGSTDGSGSTTTLEVKAQVFSSAGTPVGGEFLVNTATAGAQSQMLVTALDGGGFVVTWLDNSQGVGGATGDNTGLAVKAQVYNAAGVRVGGEILVNTATDSTESAPQIIALKGGGFAVSWQDVTLVGGGVGGDGDGSAIKAQVFGADGSRDGAEIHVNTATAGGQTDPEIAALDDGGFVVVWRDDSRGVGGAGGDTSGSAVKAQLFDAHGVKVGSEIRVNTTTAGNQENPDVVALSHGAFVVTWSDGLSSIRAQAFAANGERIGGEQLVSTTAAIEKDPEVVALPDGFAISWQSVGANADVKAQVYQLLNDKPVLDHAGGSTSFLEAANVASTPVKVAAGITITDTDDATLKSAQVSISGGFQANQDVLAFTNDHASMGDIAGSYNASTGVLTLTSANGASTLAQWQAALQSVTYSNTSDAPTVTDRTVSFQVSDSVDASDPATQTVTLTAVNDRPELANVAGVTSFVEGVNVLSTPVKVASGLTVTDGDNTTLVSAKVSLTGGFHAAEDLLAFVNNPATMGNIALGGYDAATGVLTLTSAGGTATLAQWQAALQSVTYTNSSDTPDTTSRTVTIVVNDGVADSDVATRTITVTAMNDHPELSGSGGTAAFIEGANIASTPVTVAAGLTVVDVDNETLRSATVSVVGNHQAGADVLLFANDSATMGDISGAYDDATGVLTLTSSGGATLAEWQAALRTVQYTNTSDDPTTASRTIAFTVNDGSDASSSVNSTVTVAAVNDAPILGGGADVTFVEGDNATSTPVAVAAHLTVADGDSHLLGSATVTLGGFHAGEDLLAFTNDPATMGDISGAYDAATGVLTLGSTAGATAAQWQAALRSVTYTNSSDAPDATDRTVTIIINDGTDNSSPVTHTLSVTPVNDKPVLDGAGETQNVLEGAVIVVAPHLTVADLDDTTLSSASVEIDHAGPEDLLAFTNDGATMGDITGAYDAATGLLTLTSTGHATHAEWQAALRSVTYANTSDNPDPADRTVTITVSDNGTDLSAPVTQTVAVIGINDAPSGADGTFSVITDRTHVFKAVDFGFADPAEGDAFAGVVIKSLPGAGALTLDGVAVTADQSISAADIAAGKLVFTPGAGALGDDYAEFSFQVRDDGGTDNGGVDLDPTPRTLTIDVLPHNDPPVLSGGGGATAFTEGANMASTPVTVAADLVVADPDNGTLHYALVSVGGFHAGEDVLGFANDGGTMGDIAGAFDATTGVLTLTSSSHATLAEWQAALRAVTYTNSSDDPDPSDRTISFVVNDGVDDSVTVTQTVTVTPVNDAPVLDDAGATVHFVEGVNVISTPVAVAEHITVADGDNAALLSATVSLGGGFHANEDVLAFNYDAATMGDIQASYDAGAGVLTMTSGGHASLAEWEAALRAVTYTNSSENPDPTDRTVSIVIYDGTDHSVAVAHDLTVTPLNDAPAGTDGSVTIRAGGRVVFASANFGFNDPDGHAFAGVLISGLPHAGTLTLDGVAVTDGQFISAADIAASKLVFAPVAGARGAAYASFGFQVQDDGGTAGGGTDLDPTANTFTINVSAPTPPSGGGGGGGGGGGPKAINSGTSGSSGDDLVRLTGSGPQHFDAMGGNDDMAGGDSSDQLWGGSGDDTVWGRYGNDTIDGGPGHDLLYGEQGDDSLNGQAGNDSVFGDDGNDTVSDPTGSNYLRGGPGNDLILGGDGFDDANGNQGDDTIYGNDGADWSVGGKDNDLLFGNAGDDIVYGNMGDDTCEGGDGADIVRGGQGSDIVRGGAGDDWLAGDLGDDTIYGGAGADIFHTHANAGLDLVMDFNAAEGDRVLLLPGTQYVVAQEGADTVIEMGGPNRMVLVGVQLSSLPDGWIFGA